MFRYFCIILRDFQSFTSLKLCSFCIIKISLNIIKVKYLCIFIYFYILILIRVPGIA